MDSNKQTQDQNSKDTNSTRRSGLVVTDPYGNEIDSNSEEHRAWCEARYVMNLATRDYRTYYISMVEKIRGERAANELRGKILELWKLSKS